MSETGATELAVDRRRANREDAIWAGVLILVGVGIVAQVAIGLVPLVVTQDPWWLLVGWVMLLGVVASVVVAVFGDDRVPFRYFRSTSIAATGVLLAFLAGFASLTWDGHTCLACFGKAQLDLFIAGAASAAACAHSCVALWLLPRQRSLRRRPSSIAPPHLTTKVCPDCAESVQAEARICRFCRHEFWPGEA